MPSKTEFAYNAMISGYLQNGLMDEAKRVFDKMPVKNIVSWNVILSGYLQNGLLDEAKRVFDEMPVKNVVSWTTILSGYIQNGLMDKAKRVFDEMPVKNVFSWTTILSGYVQNGLLDLAKRIFDEMPVKNIFSWNVILSGYMQNGLMDEARRIFDEMPNRDSVSWATMIGGYGQNGDNKEALRFFIEATRDWERLNTCAFAFVLSTCADIVAFELGKQIHGRVVKGGIEFKCNVGNALVSMYCSCGNIKEAYDVFKRIEDKDVISWNTIINGYARHGYGQEALQHFDSMKQTSIQPDEITMVGVLTACSHTGLVDKGTHYFYSMSQDHGIEPDIKHYNCLIDLLGRAGRLDEAQNLVKSMPFEPNGVTWTCLLSASRIHESTELGEKAAKMLLSLEPWNTSLYVLLSNLYAASGRWEDVKKMQLKMRGMGITKTKGSSWVKVLNKVHTFCVGDFTHPDSKSICAFLEELDLRMISISAHSWKSWIRGRKRTDMSPQQTFVLHDVEEEELLHTLKYHCERLVVAYGIMKIPSGRPVCVFKNLCGDRTLTKIAGRLIILRDVGRFHHFEGGVYNCGSYW
uniref:Pentatricopeptide repeat protein n=1 Tax=Salvia miltiorrhiza TaxID=226208 RepID=A0A678WG17_SALMI|nr:pentatricopeptide repeat protein [Salvia miltiorrhiza]